MGGQGVDFLLRVGQTDNRATLEVDLFLKKHRLLVYTAESTCCSRYDERTELTINLVDASVENLMHRASSLVTGIINLNLEDIASARATVSKGIICINCHTVYEAFIVAQLAVHIG